MEERSVVEREVSRKDVPDQVVGGKEISRDPQAPAAIGTVGDAEPLPQLATARRAAAALETTAAASREPNESGREAIRVLAPAQHARISGRDPRQDAARDRPVLVVEHFLAVSVDERQHQGDERLILRLDRRPVELFVRQRLRVETHQFVVTADEHLHALQVVRPGLGARVGVRLRVPVARNRRQVAVSVMTSVSVGSHRRS